MSVDGISYLLAVFATGEGWGTASFGRWWEQEHCPSVRAAGVVGRCLRLEGVGAQPDHLLLYELDTPARFEAVEQAVLHGPAGLLQQGWLGPVEASAVRYRFRSAHPAGARLAEGARFALAVRLFVSPGAEAEVRRWLDEEHAVRQLGVSGALSYHGFEKEGEGFHFFNLWGLQAPDVADSPAWDAARQTPWRERLKSVMQGTLRGVFRVAAGAGAGPGGEGNRG